MNVNIVKTKQETVKQIYPRAEYLKFHFL